MSVLPYPGTTCPRETPSRSAASGLFHRLFHGVRLRARFAFTWVQRGLGITQPRSADPALLEHGCTFVCPGIEAESIFTWGICDGLSMGGVPGGMKIFNWGLPLPGGYFANLCYLQRNRRRAADLAREILAYQDAYPGRPVNIACQSGGAGVSIFATELLPEGREIDSVILLNGALSPTYDLRKALRRTKRGILNSYSPKDSIVLGLGTRALGTIDRQFCDACGRVGFVVPQELSDEDRALYAKLHQIEWRQEHADTCHHWGGHITSATEEYLATYIAPWVTGRS